ncbi:MAG: hypothetical protein JWQ04_734, partial [Pedosphaera sp.]|nr:hypothetical protein [Pedosphaera sp.]
MDSDQAKEILARYRPGETATDPKVGEALELARRDPQLAAWFEKHRAIHGNTPSRPEGGAVPAAHPGRERIITPALVVAGLAILVLLAAFLGSYTAPRPKDAFTSYRDRMARL